MTDSIRPHDLLERVGLQAADVPHVLAAQVRSEQGLAVARARLAELKGGVGGAVAMGSLGRSEYGECSDLDFIYLYDGAETKAEEAEAGCEERVDLLRSLGFDVSTKNFGGAVNIEDLLVNIGGNKDRTLSLTYRALLLTESAWLDRPERVRDFRERVLEVYRGAQTRGKFMALLLNELNRYYRTLLVDYRYKIEEDGKSFGDRNIKLRHSRKLWYLAHLALHCTAGVNADGDPDRHDARVADNLGSPSLVKLTLALEEIGEASSCGDVWRAHDYFLGRMCEPDVREALEAVRPGTAADESVVFADLKRNADRLQQAAIQVIDAINRNDAARDTLLHYGLL